MLIAGETSGDLLAAELAPPLRARLLAGYSPLSPPYQPLRAALRPRLWGAGGSQMAQAGVELDFDLTEHSVTGLSDAVREFLKFRRLFNRLFRRALERQPQLIICVDFSGFNRRLAAAIRRHTRARAGWFHNWQPKIVQYVSPQVWASRARRSRQVARDYDLLLSIIPFEKEWYEHYLRRQRSHHPSFSVQYVGHPVMDRYAGQAPGARSSELHNPPTVLLLPGSREGELRRHLPPMIGALAMMRASIPDLSARMVLPGDNLLRLAKAQALPSSLEVQSGGLADALRAADVAIASTGTVTMECAYFGVPTVALYRTSWSTFQIGKRIVSVKHLAMPNLLAKKEVFPEFIQDAATPENLGAAALDLLRDGPRRQRIQADLSAVITSLGPPGAADRAADAIMGILHD